LLEPAQMTRLDPFGKELDDSVDWFVDVTVLIVRKGIDFRRRNIACVNELRETYGVERQIFAEPDGGTFQSRSRQ
jgi:hypothetical protein